MNMNQALSLGTILSLLAFSPLHAASWPEFRGPGGTGIALEGGSPPVSWSAAENLAWKTELPGPGSSSPIVWGDRIFVTCYSGYGVERDKGAKDNLQRHLVCVDRQNGKILWNRTVSAALPEDSYRGYLTEHGYASGTPVTDGERVYVFFGKSGAIAYDFDGNQLWKTNLGKSSSNRRWGSAASPILYKDLLIVNASEEARAVIALNKRTGKEVWRADSRSLELSFGTPLLVDHKGQRTDLVVAMPGELWGLNPDTGRQRWSAAMDIPGNVSPSVSGGGGILFATGGYPKKGSIAVRSGGEGDVTGSHVAWTSETASYVPTPIIHDGRIFVVTEKGYALAFDARSGDIVINERLPGLKGSGVVYASPILANGRFYIATRRDGVYVLEAGSAVKVLAQNTLAGDDTDFNATPAIVDGQIILRSNQTLYCVEAGTRR